METPQEDQYFQALLQECAACVVQSHWRGCLVRQQLLQQVRVRGSKASGQATALLCADPMLVQPCRGGPLLAFRGTGASFGQRCRPARQLPVLSSARGGRTAAASCSCSSSCLCGTLRVPTPARPWLP